MPSSCNCVDVREKRASHDSILLACADNFRPMSERNVPVSGTKGVGEGILGGLIEVCSSRHCGNGAAKNVVGIRCI